MKLNRVRRARGREPATSRAQDRMHTAAHHPGTAAMAALIITAASAAGAAGQSAGPVTASAAALGIGHAEAVGLERQWDALDEPTRRRVRCAGTRGTCRTFVESLRVFRAIPEVFRTGGTARVRRFLRNKDWSHIVPRSAGENDSAANGRWEARAPNRSRGNRMMTPEELRNAESMLRSEAFRERLRRSLRVLRWVGLGTAAVTAVMMMRHLLDFHHGRISEAEMIDRIGREVARSAVAATAVMIVSGAVSLAHPGAAVLLGPVAGIIAVELWNRHGRGEPTGTIPGPGGPVLVRERVYAYAAVEPVANPDGPADPPAVKLTATSRTLYPPLFDDPWDLIEDAAEALGLRGARGPEPLPGT